MLIAFNQGTIPIKPLKEREVTARVAGPIATIAQKTECVVAEMAFAAPVDIGTGPASQNLIMQAGTRLFMLPDAAFQPWNKVVYEANGIQFVRAPTSQILAIEHADPQGHSEGYADQPEHSEG